MARPTRLAILSFALALVLLALLLPLTSVSETSPTTPGIAANGQDGLIVDTAGSVWYAADGAYWFDAFAPFDDRLHVVTTVPLQQVLQEHVDLQMASDENRWFDAPVTEPISEALVVDLQGTSQGISGLNTIMYLYEGGDLIQRTFDSTSARSLHLDRPPSQTYRIQLESLRPSTCTLRVGIGQSPYLAEPLDDYAFLLVSDSGPLSNREIARIHQFVEAGGNLVAMAQLIDGMP